MYIILTDAYYIDTLCTGHENSHDSHAIHYGLVTIILMFHAEQLEYNFYHLSAHLDIQS